MAGLGDFLLHGIGGAAEAGAKDMQEQRTFERQMSLEDWKFQRQKELADYENDLSIALEKLKAKHGTMQRAEEQGFEVGLRTLEEDAHMARTREEIAGRERVAEINAASRTSATKDTKMNKTEREMFIDNFQEDVLDAYGIDTYGANANEIKAEIRDNPQANALMRRFRREMAGDLTREQAAEIYNQFLEDLEGLGSTTQTDTGGWSIVGQD